MSNFTYDWENEKENKDTNLLCPDIHSNFSDMLILQGGPNKKTLSVQIRKCNSETDICKTDEEIE